MKLYSPSYTNLHYSDDSKQSQNSTVCTHICTIPDHNPTPYKFTLNISLRSHPYRVCSRAREWRPCARRSARRPERPDSPAPPSTAVRGAPQPPPHRGCFHADRTRSGHYTATVRSVKFSIKRPCSYLLFLLLGFLLMPHRPASRYTLDPVTRVKVHLVTPAHLRGQLGYCKKMWVEQNHQLAGPAAAVSPANFINATHTCALMYIQQNRN